MSAKELQLKDKYFLIPKSELSWVDGDRKGRDNSEAFCVSWTMFYKQERKKWPKKSSNLYSKQYTTYKSDARVLNPPYEAICKHSLSIDSDTQQGP